jgi:hypothetical protein
MLDAGNSVVSAVGMKPPASRTFVRAQRTNLQQKKIIDGRWAIRQQTQFDRQG